MKIIKIIGSSIVLILVLFLVASISNAKYVLDCETIAAKLNIDRTKPMGTVSYSTQEPTKENVIVTIVLSEPISEVEGWSLAENKLSMTKIYEQNSIDTIKIVDLSGNENTVEVSVQNIDKNAPIINLTNIQNTNVSYEKYANNTHTVTATIQITDMNIKEDIDISEINVIVGENKNICQKNIKNLEQLDTEIVFDLVLNFIEENGKLKLEFPDEFITDSAGNSSKKTSFDTGITIDNIKPQGTFSQEILETGKVQAYIKTDEEIRNLEEWENTNNVIYTKVFPANVSYILEIVDYAQNKSQVEVNVTGATYIVLTYASHNSEVGWTYGYGNYDIAGKEAVKLSDKYKAEALAFKITGNADRDFVRIRGYVHSFWNSTSSFGLCSDTGYKYKLGSAPSENSSESYSMNSLDLSNIDGQEYIQFGGADINTAGKTDYYGNNPIPAEAIWNGPDRIYPYGVSEIQMSLANYSELSIVYQILVVGQGWLETATNGSTTSAGKEKPMSAIRAAIIPNSEVQKLVTLWNKDVGTYKVD